jgi:hypothetical protein
LMAWCCSRRSGDRDNQCGIRIGTLDNPGWYLDVDLAGMRCVDSIPLSEMIERSEDDWIFYEVKDFVFRVRGGASNLSEMICLFLSFFQAEVSDGIGGAQAVDAGGNAMSGSSGILNRLQRWYRSQCDGDWEHSCGVKIETLDNPGWLVTVDLDDTPWEQLVVLRSITQRSEADWVQFEISGAKFVGCGGAGNLEEVLELFLGVVEQG